MIKQVEVLPKRTQSEIMPQLPTKKGRKSTKGSVVPKRSPPVPEPPPVEASSSEEEEDRGLSELQKAHLIVDVDKYPAKQFQHIVKLNYDYYFPHRASFRNRYQHLKRIRLDRHTKTKKKKETGPSLYFRLLGEAKNLLEKS